MSTRPTVNRPELCLPDRRVNDEYRPCDLPMLILTTVLSFTQTHNNIYSITLTIIRLKIQVAAKTQT